MTAAKNKSYRHHVAVIAAIVVIITSGYAVSSDVNVVDVIADVMFTTMLDVAYAMHGTLVLTATDNIDDDDSSLLELDAADGITIFTLDGKTYAAVASQSDDGVQILNVTDPANITATDQLTDDGSIYRELDGADGITTFTLSDGKTYAAVAAIDGDAVQMLDVSDPTDITNGTAIYDTDGILIPGGYALDGASGITAFTLSDGNTYVAVASEVDDGVQILDVTDIDSITFPDKITDNDALALKGATAISTFELPDGNTYAAVASIDDNGVQILNVTDPTDITPTDNIIDAGDLVLSGAHDIATFKLPDGNTYAAVASWHDNGVQILNVTDPTDITPTDNITDTDGNLALGTSNEVTIFTSGDHTYAAVTSQVDNGVQILDVSDPTDITPTTKITDDGDLELARAVGITTFTLSDGKTYIAVTAYDDDGVQIIRIDITEPDTAFITTWETTAVSESISIPVEVHTSGTLTIDWGDGSAPESVTANGTETHTYAASGEYQVSMTGDLSRINLGASGSTPAKLLSIDHWGDIEWSTMENAFWRAANMEYRATDAPDLSGVTSMSSMFFGATSFDGDISGWNVSSVTDMSGMFRHATSFDGNISGWNVSSVTDMSGMFRHATSFDQPLNDWGVSSVTDMSSMFFSATSFDQPLNDWGVSSVTDMSSMFFSASSFNQPLSNWDVSSVTYMSSMFFSASSFNQPLSRWDVSSVTYMSSMFFSASSFNQPLSGWNVSSVTNMRSMFSDATSFNGNLSSWNVSSVADMSNMFYDASSFNGNLSIWNVSSVDNMLYMFDDASSFNQNLGNWYVVPADTTYATSEGTLNVTTISAQNMRLDGHSPSYGIGSDGNSNLFNITDSNTLMFKSTPPADTYNVNVTASGTDVFANGNNWRLLEIRVTGQTTDTTPPVITLTGSSTVTITVGDTYSDAGATCTDNVDASPTLTSSGIVDTSQTGTYTVTYSCADTAGNTATPVSRTVNVEAASDTTPPVITLTGSSSTPNLVLIDQWGNTQWTSMESAFYGANNMVYKARSADCAGQCALYADARMCFCADDDRAAGRICNACGLKAEGARDASMSESDSRYATPLSVGVHAYRGVVP